jgi:hypothetical protein
VGVAPRGEGGCRLEVRASRSLQASPQCAILLLLLTTPPTPGRTTTLTRLEEVLERHGGGRTGYQEAMCWVVVVGCEVLRELLLLIGVAGRCWMK